MKVLFKTNLDWYRTVAWPTLDTPPPIGTTVHVSPGSEPFCRVNKIPSRLKVVAHDYYFDRVEVELWYLPIDTESANLSGKLPHLYKQD